MKTILFTLIFGHIATSFSFADSVVDCSKLKNDCEFYSCIEKQKACGKSGYPLAFGKRYCLKFNNFTSQKMSAAGKEWLSDIRSCLTDQIQQMPNDITCNDLKQKALKSHYHCYYKVNFCKLSKRDKFQVIKTMKSEYKNKQIVKLGWRVLRSCKWF